MNAHETVSARQLCMLVFLSLAVDMAVRPFTTGNGATAQNIVVASILNTALVSFLLLPVLGLLRGAAFSTLHGGVTAGSRILLTASALLFAMGCSAGMLRAEEFFRYVSDEPLSQFIVYGLMFLVALYTLRCGLESLVRVAGVLLVIFLCSIGLMFVSNLQQVRFANLTFAPFSAGQVLQTAVRGFVLPPELLLFCLLSLRSNREKRRPLLKTLTLLCVFYILLAFFSEAVLGIKAQMQSQIIHTLSRLGSISVFRRLDALHTGAWMLAALCKASALAYGAQDALSSVLPRSQRPAVCWYTLCLTGLFLGGCALLTPDMLRAVLTAATALLLGGITVYGYVMEAFYAKKHV